MKLLILCVDGFDPTYSMENGFDKFRHSASLDIPKECFIETPDGPQPATGKVWPTIFSGKVQAHALIRRTGPRKWAHDNLLKLGIRWSGKARYMVNPWNKDLDTVFTGLTCFTWNLPTISPEWLVSFPDYKDIIKYSRREYLQFITLAHGLQSRGFLFDVGALYTRILDVQGHIKGPEDLKWLYADIAQEAWRLSQKQLAQDRHLMLISDHGVFDGVHTDKAYIGATFPFEATSVLDIRGIIEGALNV